MKLQEFEKIAKMLAKEHKISIEEGESWAANIKNRIVFYRKEDIYNLPEDHILGLILHEVAHIHYTNEVDMKKEKFPELTRTTLNVLEDISIEKIIGKDYPNAEEILESTKSDVLDNLLKILPKLKTSRHEKALLFAATRFEGRGYNFGTEQYEKVGEKIAEVMIKKEQEILKRKETKNLMPLVTEIVNILLKEIGDPTDLERQQMQENNRINGGKANSKDGASACNAKKQTINALKAGKGWKEGIPIGNRISFIDAIGDQAAMVGKKLRSVLKRNNAMEFGGRYRSGKLLTKRLVRIKTLKDRKPFGRRIIKSNQSYAFAIASDVSGSMFDSCDANKTLGSYALNSMYMVGEALRIAGVPRSLTIFGDKSIIAAPMGKLPITFEQLGNEKIMREADDGGTDIATAIKTCTEELSKIKAERKIMIILTDGSSSLMAMQEAHKQAVKAGIEPLGITIGTPGQKQMEQTFSEEKNRIIEETSNKQKIGQTFIEILKESIKLSSSS